MSATNRVATFVPIKLNRRRGRRATFERCENGIETTTLTSESVVANLAPAFYWQRLLDEGRVSSGAEIAEREGLHVSTVNELLRLTMLDPQVIEDALHHPDL